MELLGILLVLGAIVGEVISLVLLVMKCIKREPKKPIFLSMAICFITFVVGLVITPTNNNEHIAISTDETIDEYSETIISDDEPDDNNNTEEDLKTYFESNETINLYINRFNALNQDCQVKKSNIYKYNHHGRAHDDQAHFYIDGFEIVLTDNSFLSSGNKIKVYVGYTAATTHTNEEYGDMFVKFAKVFCPDKSDEEIRQYWGRAANNGVTKFDEFECDIPYSDRISYFTIEGSFE